MKAKHRTDTQTQNIEAAGSKWSTPERTYESYYCDQILGQLADAVWKKQDVIEKKRQRKTVFFFPIVPTLDCWGYLRLSKSVPAEPMSDWFRLAGIIPKQSTFDVDNMKQTALGFGI